MTVNHLRTGTSQFLTLDHSRMDAFSPSPHAAFPSPIQKTSGQSRIRRQTTDGTRPQEGTVAFPQSAQDSFPKSATRLPNRNFEFDIGLLNLHLLLRVEEILGCAEAMWDYVLDYQEIHAPPRLPYLKGPPPRVLVHPRISKRPADEPMHGILMDLTRHDFDTLLSRFGL